MDITLPDSMRFIERDWLSANQVLFFDGPDSASLVDTGYVKHAALTCTLVERLLSGRRLVRIINTHLHSDHCGGNRALTERHHSELLIPIASYQAAKAWDVNRLTYQATGQRCDPFEPTGFLQSGDCLELGGMKWSVYAAPGHDPDSILLYAARDRILISADALWEDGFGVTFPELSGESGFREQGEVLDLIASLDPVLVIPGHGPMFSDVGAALMRARSRLDWLAQDPQRNARHALKVLVKFLMLDLERASIDQLLGLLGEAEVLRDSGSLLGLSATAAVQWALDSLVRTKALLQDGEIFVCPGVIGAPS